MSFFAKTTPLRMLKMVNSLWGAMKSLDAILHIYQDTKETKITLELSTLRKKLGLEKNNNYVDRIKTYLMELKLPFELRDFHKYKTGKEISFALTSFLN